jgi:predicted amidohydrolase YtcJ
MRGGATARAPRISAALAAAALALGCTKAAEPPGGAADLVFRHGPVYTATRDGAGATAVAVRGGRIVYVGSDSGVARWVGSRTRVTDLAGRLLLPGFHDSHVHPVSSGIDLGECQLTDLPNLRAVTDAITRYAADHPDAKWIRGSGWALPLFPKANPSRRLLDSLVPDRPALLVAADGHSAWANTKALAAGGVTRATKDPPRGRIERDPSGEPSGTLRESAIGLVSKAIPPYTRDDYVAGLRRALVEAAKFGITSMYEASANEEELAAYSELDRRGQLTARVIAAQYVDPARGPAQVAPLAARRELYKGNRYFRPIGAKIFADGVIESGTAALLQPYVGREHDRGIANLEPAAFNSLVTALDSAGFQVHIHAIGDRGVRWSLDALEAAARANGPRDRRPLIAHLQMIDPADVPRFKALGVIADFQPLWAYEDSYIKDLTIPVLGPERSSRLYPIGSVARTGAVIAGGSDWSVTSLNPLEAIQVGVTRLGLDDSTGAAWLPDERVGLDTLLLAYTANGAYAQQQEKETGTIELGKAADLVVLDRDIRTVPPIQIHRAKVLLTLLEGREVYRAGELASAR